MEDKKSNSKDDNVVIARYNKKIEKTAKIRDIVLNILYVIIMVFYFLNRILFLIGLFIFLIVAEIFAAIKNHYKKCQHILAFKHIPKEVQDRIIKDYKNIRQLKICLTIILVMFFPIILSLILEPNDPVSISIFVILGIDFAIIFPCVQLIRNISNHKIDPSKIEEKINIKRRIIYTRESVCAGDDVDPSPIDIWLRRKSTVEELVQKILASSRSVANYGPTTHWVLQSSAGDLADITLDEREKEVIKYLQYPKEYLVKDLKIDSVYAERVYSKK